jgi:hypothetical protein
MMFHLFVGILFLLALLSSVLPSLTKDLGFAWHNGIKSENETDAYHGMLPFLGNKTTLKFRIFIFYPAVAFAVVSTIYSLAQ